MGTRRYNTADSSRNSLFLALITLGEGWHNNHHRFPASERQGFFWYELDITHYILVVLSWFGIVWGLKGPSEEVLAEAKFFDELKKTLNPDDLQQHGHRRRQSAQDREPRLRILVTGASGFIGQRIVAALAKRSGTRCCA